MSIADCTTPPPAIPDTSSVVAPQLLKYDSVSKTLQWIAVAFFAIATLQRPFVADVATNNPTNYNVVTTLLGTLTSAVNAANANQNTIGAAVNVLLSIARERGDIAGS